MIVAVQGVYEQNKGALLMLEAIRERLAQEIPYARIAVPTSISSLYRREHGYLGLRSGRSRKTKLLSLIPKSILFRFGLVLPSQVDVLLDASGFGYGDFWGIEKLRTRLTQMLQGWKRPDRVAVLLPQALGPFDMPGMKTNFLAALDLFDLAFVRDTRSMAHVDAVTQDHPAVRAAPDFTNLLHPQLKPEFAHLLGHSFVIPNEKMVAGNRASQRASYVQAMAAAVSEIRSSGRTVDLLVHEGAADWALTEEINALLSEPAEIVDLPSPLDTKAAIAAAELIVSSRFHGLVSALSSGVPALAVGWSHKYDELMNDYGVSELNADVGDLDIFNRKVKLLLETATSPSQRANLVHSASVQRMRSEAMWTEVVERIRAVKNK